MFPADRTFARGDRLLGDRSMCLPSGLVGVNNSVGPVTVVNWVLPGGNDAILLPLDFGGWGNDAIETTRRGAGVLERSMGSGSEGVVGRPPSPPADCGMMDRPPGFFREGV